MPCRSIAIVAAVYLVLRALLALLPLLLLVIVDDGDELPTDDTLLLPLLLLAPLRYGTMLVEIELPALPLSLVALPAETGEFGTKLEDNAPLLIMLLLTVVTGMDVRTGLAPVDPAHEH